MRNYLAAIALLILSFSASAQTQSCQNHTFTPAAGTSLLCSATWLMSGGTCNNTDLVFSWTVSGRTTPGTWNIPAWEAQPITIRGIELTMAGAAGPTLWWMAGNNYTPDSMLWLGPNENHGKIMYPAGTGMPFPAAGTVPTAYLDLHGACSGGSGVQFFYTVYYTVP